MSSDRKDRFGDGVVQITIPKGSRGAFLDGLSGIPTERELLLPRKSVFRVTGRAPDGTVYMELIP